MKESVDAIATTFQSVMVLLCLSDIKNAVRSVMLGSVGDVLFQRENECIEIIDIPVASTTVSRRWLICE